MIVNDVDVKRYRKSFNSAVVEGARQFLQVFKCCDELLNALDLLKKQDLEEARIHAEALMLEAYNRKLDGKLSREEEKKFRDKLERKARCTSAPKQVRELAPLMTVVGICDHCNSVLKGEPIPGCETKKSGRVFYAECSACTYYYEIFKKRNKFNKVEGGLEDGTE